MPLLWEFGDLRDADPEAVRLLETSRVLTHGTAAEVRAIGLENIRRDLPRLNLPGRIREFWEWVFTRVFPGQADGHPQPSAEIHPARNR